MITEWLLSISAAFIGWIGSLFPTWQDQAVLDQLPGFINTVMGWFAGLGVWVDWGVLTACVTVQLIVTLAVFIIKLVRAAAAHIPLFGGHGA